MAILDLLYTTRTDSVILDELIIISLDAWTLEVTRHLSVIDIHNRNFALLNVDIPMPSQSHDQARFN